MANPLDQKISGLFLLHWQVMNINMTSQAVGEHLQLFLVVWLRVTLTTIRNLAVLLMAHGTEDLTVLARSPLPFGIDTFMATTAGLHFDVILECNLEWCMHSCMTGHTFSIRLGIVVTIMTLGTVRDIAMFLIMAGLATLFGMSTRELL